MLFTKEEKLAIIFIIACSLVGAGFFYYKRAQSSAFEIFAIKNIPEEQKQVNINAASIRELISLKRIGPVLAERIVLYREENGPFQSAEDVKRVKGIGEHTYRLIKKRITLE
ncbi:MAG: ComEA family DNA-binding protein [Candidatus Omnitrophica bacterium]|nr:ComEA family DNA-binding protein [Candidatus Omnitrophota bacterium]